MRIAKRIDAVPPYLFVEINRKIAEKKKRGEDVISFAIGDPDLPTPPHILDRLIKETQIPANHRYPESDGLPELRQAIARWYQGRFGVELDQNKEVVPLIGSKEGIGHVALCLIDPGDIALVPDPAYPVYSMGTLFAGGESYPVSLLEENRFLPELEDIPTEALKRAKVLWINYPNNPTGAVADVDFYGKVVEFAGKHDLAVCNDAPYSEITFDGYKPTSFLEAEGAKDVGIEFHSFSKTYNMTGWRIGMAVGNAELIRTLTTVKSNLDSGIPQAIQYAAIEALQGPQGCVEENASIYQRRRDRMVQGLARLGLRVQPPKASFYLWARVPKGSTSVQYATKLLDEVSVVVTPGVGYGQQGEGYIRLSLTVPDHRIDEALERIGSLS
ncbi:MAG: LL-diaminopimelate aminotransferase [Dehalococcoidia bacterium]